MKIAICDDDQDARETLADQIKKFKALKRGELSLDLYELGETLYEVITKGTCYDVIFLDIDMPGMNGIEAGKSIRQYDSRVKIVYVTNYSDFQNRAFEVHAFGYLAKPVSLEAIDDMLFDVIQYLREDDKRRTAQIIFKTEDGSHAFRYSDIYYIEAVGHKVKVFTTQGEYLVSKSIGDVHEEMQAHDFYMCHKSYLVNLGFARRIIGCDIELLNNLKVPIAQKKVAKFKAAFNNYLQTTMN